MRLCGTGETPFVYTQIYILSDKTIQIIEIKGWIKSYYFFIKSIIFKKIAIRDTLWPIQNIYF